MGDTVGFLAATTFIFREFPADSVSAGRCAETAKFNDLRRFGRNWPVSAFGGHPSGGKYRPMLDKVPKKPL
jgi:hypothetical protein